MDKVCRCCGEDKLLSEMVRWSRNPDKYSNECKSCKSRYDKERREKPDVSARLKKLRKKYYSEHKADHKAQTVAWNKNNKEKRSAIRKRWYEKNRPLVRMYKANRRLREFNLSDGTVTKEAIMGLQTDVCGICGLPIDIDEKDSKNYSAIHLDHIVPLTVGGSHSIDNLQWTHAKCNLSKGGRI